MEPRTNQAFLVIIALLLAAGMGGFLLYSANRPVEMDSGAVDELPVSSVAQSSIASSLFSSSAAAASADASSIISVSSSADYVSSASLTSAMGGLNASKTVVTFYQEWVTHRGSPMQDRVYDSSPYISAGLRTRLAAWTDASLDPIVCFSKDPPLFEVLSVQGAGETAVVRLRETFPDQTIEFDVRLVRAEGMWRIDGVDCPATSAQSSSL